ncbi:MAG: peroxidase family protein, partial [Hyphomicrobiaceae bacterium]
MPAGYTFLAQFIDHDITFDATSMLNRPIRDEEFENARTVALDLDSVYGRGPEQDPYLYNLPYLRVGKWIAGCGYNARFDLLRSRKGTAPGPRGGAARALIGDPRNDENFIVAQLHGAFLAFHNRLTDLLIARRLNRSGQRTCAPDRDCDVRRFAAKLSRTEKQQIFEAARDHVIYYYHRIILEDFLPRLIGEERLHRILENGRSFFFPNGFDGNGRSKQHPFIPVEFAVGAFRYGHSQVRERYQLRRGVRTTLLEAATGRGGGSPAFQPLQRRHLVDWRYFFPISRNRLRGFNFARRIDPEITPFLHELGRSRVVGRNDVVSLPARNLIRGRTFRLPSGQAIAARILPVLHNRGMLPSGTDNRARRNTRRTTEWSAYLLRPDRRTRRILQRAETPLWYYILQEAALYGRVSGFGGRDSGAAISHRRTGIRYASLSRRVEHAQPYPPGYLDEQPERGVGGHTLGPVGATFVGEVLTGLIEQYRAKPGKGLSLRPVIRAKLRSDDNAQLSLTPMPHIYPNFYGRYLMRNMLIDAGHAEPASLSEGDAHTCRKLSNGQYQPTRTIPGLRKRWSREAPGHYPTRTRNRADRRSSARNAGAHWSSKVFQND